MEKIEDIVIGQAMGDIFDYLRKKHPDKDVFEFKIGRVRGHAENSLDLTITDFDYKNIDEGC
jgi:hypothetical protein